MSLDPASFSKTAVQAGDATSLVPSVTSVVAPQTKEEISDEIATSSPAVSVLVLTSNAPSVSPVAAATAIGPIIPSMGPSAMSSVSNMSRPKIEKIKPQMGMNGGRWTEQEHQSFLAGLRLYGREWKKVASKIKTRTSAQIRSHAQKYFAKLARDDEIRKHAGSVSQHEGVASQSTSSLYGYYSDGGSSATVNSGDDDADTDSSTSQRSSHHQPPVSVPGSIFAVAGAQVESSHEIPSFPALVPGSASAVAHLYNPASKVPPSHQTKKRSRAISAAETARALQPLGTSSSSPHFCKHRKIIAKEAVAVDLLPSQEELLEKVSPNIRQRFSSLIEAEICALQVLSCYALLQRQDLSRPRQIAAEQTLANHTSSLLGAATSGTFPGQASMGVTMIATEQIPSMSSIY
ncbi:Lhy protein, partial [Globisporangium splendens]